MFLHDKNTDQDQTPLHRQIDGQTDEQGDSYIPLNFVCGERGTIKSQMCVNAFRLYSDSTNHVFLCISRKVMCFVNGVSLSFKK